jgi:hypothetical protein
MFSILQVGFNIFFLYKKNYKKNYLEYFKYNFNIIFIK